MPKQKTRKSISKRFKKTGSGRIKRSSAGRGHLFTGKSRKVKRNRRKGGMVDKSDEQRLAIHLPR